MLQTKVLIIDDEKDFVKSMEERLTLRGIAVSTAYDGVSGIGALDQHPNTEVVLLDVQMPGMSGVETLRQIKASHPGVEVIMLTGHATVETAIEGMKLGAFDYLLKPYDIDNLLRKLEAASNKAGQQQARIMEARSKELRGRLAR